MEKSEMLNVVADHCELGNALQVVNDNGDYKVYALCSDGMVELKPKFPPDENWVYEIKTIGGNKYTVYFTKNGDDWVLGVYDGSKCVVEKKCNRWHKPDGFMCYIDTRLRNPSDYNVDCAYID